MNKKIYSTILTLLALVPVGCSDTDDYKVATGNILSKVETGSAQVGATNATISGTVLDLSQSASSSYVVGVSYSTSDDATKGTKVAGQLADDGTVTTTLNGLKTDVTYYYCTYVTLQGKLTQYGEVKQFVTTDADIATAGKPDACVSLLDQAIFERAAVRADVDIAAERLLTAAIGTAADGHIPNAGVGMIQIEETMCARSASSEDNLFRRRTRTEDCNAARDFVGARIGGEAVHTRRCHIRSGRDANRLPGNRGQGEGIGERPRCRSFRGIRRLRIG